MQTKQANEWSNAALLRFAVAHLVLLCIAGTNDGALPSWYALGGILVLVGWYALRDGRRVVSLGGLIDLDSADRFFDGDAFFYFLIRIVLGAFFFVFMCALVFFQIIERDVKAKTEAARLEREEMLRVGPPFQPLEDKDE